MNTRFIAAYDTERTDCLQVCNQLVGIHEQFAFPATFFIVGYLLEPSVQGNDYTSLLGNTSEFEIASHSYSHTRVLIDNPWCGVKADNNDRQYEIDMGKTLVEQTFGRPCWGFRTPCGAASAMRDDTWLVNAMADAGYGYVSSWLWGPDNSMPANPVSPFNYLNEGRPELWEMPSHGWHDNALKGDLTSPNGNPPRLIHWPLRVSKDAIPLAPVVSPDQEFAVNRAIIDQAVFLDLPYVSLVWHPWSIVRNDSRLRMVEMTFAYVKSLGMEATTYEQEWRRAALL